MAQNLKRKEPDTPHRSGNTVSAKQSRADIAGTEDEFYRQLATELVPQMVASRFEALTPELKSRNTAFASYSVMAAVLVTRGLDLSSAELVTLTTGAKAVFVLYNLLLSSSSSYTRTTAQYRMV